LVEFDGPHHRSIKQRIRDAEKDALAMAVGFKVFRRRVAAASMIPVSAIEGL
jgi:very-short-patch-repair endonuclease